MVPLDLNIGFQCPGFCFDSGTNLQPWNWINFTAMLLSLLTLPVRQVTAGGSPFEARDNWAWHFISLFLQYFWNDLDLRGFLKWWYPTTIGFPTKNDHFRLFWGYYHLRKHGNTHLFGLFEYEMSSVSHSFFRAFARFFIEAGGFDDAWCRAAGSFIFTGSERNNAAAGWYWKSGR